jgi:hypothetical protein
MPRWLVLLSIVGAALVIPAIGEYRAKAKENPIEAFKQIDFAEQFNEYFDEDTVSEVKNALVLIAATQQSNDYELGAGYWNRIVFRFVPAQIFGEHFKSSLMIEGGQRDFGDFLEETVGYKVPVGSTITGIGDSFNEFGYFGCLVFAAIAYLFKNLWTAAIDANSTVAQILYIQVSTSAMRALTHQTIDFLPGFIYGALFISLVAIYAKERPALRSKVRRPTPTGQPVNLPPVRQP